MFSLILGELNDFPTVSRLLHGVLQLSPVSLGHLFSKLSGDTGCVSLVLGVFHDYPLVCHDCPPVFLSCSQCPPSHPSVLLLPPNVCQWSPSHLPILNYQETLGCIVFGFGCISSCGISWLFMVSHNCHLPFLGCLPTPNY